MSTLHLHIGSHKTGTTSIQRACRRFMSRTGEGGVRYIDIRPPATRVVRSSGRLESFRADIRPKAADAVFRPEAQAGPGADPSGLTFVASDEDFFWISDPEPVHRLAELLRARFDEVRILCYLRRQDQLATSHRKQVMENMPAARFYGVSPTPLPVYRPHLQRYFDYAGKLALWAEAFGPEAVTVVPYRRDARVGVVEDFAARTGCRFKPHKPIRANRATAGNRLLVGLKLTQAGVPAELRKQALAGLEPRGRFLPSQEAARTFLAHFEAANARLAREWRCDGAPVTFEGAFDMYPEREESHSHEEAGRMLEAAIRALCPDEPQ
jgi:hypothetical protein